MTEPPDGGKNARRPGKEHPSGKARARDTYREPGASSPSDRGPRSAVRLLHPPLPTRLRPARAPVHVVRKLWRRRDDFTATNALAFPLWLNQARLRRKVDEAGGGEERYADRTSIVAGERLARIGTLAHQPRSSDRIRADLEKAGQPKDVAGKPLDFHSARRFFATALARAGVEPEIRKVLRGTRPVTSPRTATRSARSNSSMKPSVASSWTSRRWTSWPS